MKNIKFYLLSISMFFVLVICQAQVNYNTIVNDFDQLSGSWAGYLTYLDYSSGKPYTMSTEIDVKRIDRTNKFIFSIKYPKESSANSIDTITISLDGKYLDKNLINSRKKLSNGNIQIVIEALGIDGNDDKQAKIKTIYSIEKNTFSIQKEVQFSGETKWINRHKYSFTKLPNP